MRAVSVHLCESNSCEMADRCLIDYHCLVALAEGCINFVTQQERYSNNFNHHMARGLQLINTKLSGIHALSDIAISTVIVLCLVSSIRELPSQTKVHFDGLCRMIELRGGLDQLQANPAFGEKAQRYALACTLLIFDFLL